MLKLIHDNRNKFHNNIKKPFSIYLISKSREFNGVLAGRTGTLTTLLGLQDGVGMGEAWGWGR